MARRHRRRRRGHLRPAVRIPPAERASVSRRVEELVAAGYSPRYAAHRAYQGRDAGRRDCVGIHTHGAEETAEVLERLSRDPKHPRHGYEYPWATYGFTNSNAADVFLYSIKAKGFKAARSERGNDVRASAPDWVIDSARKDVQKYAARDPKRPKGSRHALYEIRSGRMVFTTTNREEAIDFYENAAPPKELLQGGREIASSYSEGARDPRRQRHLTAAQRRALRPSQFALPERLALPIEDPAHVRNAAARLEQMRRRGTVTSGEYRSALARIRAAEARLGIGPYRMRSRRRARRDY